MRITNRLMTDNSIRNMSETLDNLYTLQQKAATGKKYLRPSDNPTVTADNLSLNSSLRMMETYTNAINSSKQWMETADFALQEIGKNLSKAQQIVLRGLNESLGPDERKTMGVEIDGILDQMIDLANYQDQDRYIFAGFRTNTKPFVLVPSTDPGAPTITVTADPADPPNPPEPTIDYAIDSVIYNGDDNTINRSISANEEVTVNDPGSEIFTDSTAGGNVFDPALKDVFATLIRIRDYLLGEDYLLPHEVQANPTPPPADIAVPVAGATPDLESLREAYSSLRGIYDKITGVMTTNGARMRNINTAMERYEKASLEIKSLISQNEEVNMAEFISEINHQELVYQATINISGRVGSMMSLFDALG